MPTEATDLQGLMKACQRGVAGKSPAIEAANNLLADCYGALGKLAAENEALRKDAKRYRWLRDSSESIHQFYLSTPIWFTCVKFSKENVDRTIDAAMTTEVQQ